MARKTTTYKDALEIVISQTVVPCYRCGVPFTRLDVRSKPSAPNAIQKEHIHEIALGGEDKPDNCRFSHKSCHDIITNGTKATKKNSSKSRIAKTKRLQEAREAKDRGEVKAAPLAKPKQKMQGRGFVKGHMKRTVSGQVVSRKRAER